MRLLLITHCGVTGGTGIRAAALGQCLVQLGHEVHLIARNDQDRWRIRRRNVEGVELYESPLGRGGRWAAQEAMPWDFLMRFLIAWRLPRFDAVICFDMLPNNAGVYSYIRWRDRCLAVVDWADLWTEGGILYEVNRPEWMRRWSHRLEIDSKKQADGVCPTSKWLYRKARGLGIGEERLLYLPFGADADGIQPKDRNQARARIGLGLDWKIVGGLGSTGGDPVLVKAVAPLLQRDPLARLLAIGPAQARSRELAHQLGVGHQLLQPGFQDPKGALNDYLASVDVFAVAHADEPNNWARGPLRVGAMMSAARPLVSNRVGELIELLEKNPIGLLAEDLEVDFSLKLEKLLQDPQLAQEMGRNGRLLLDREHSWLSLAKKLDEFMARLRR